MRRYNRIYSLLLALTAFCAVEAAAPTGLAGSGTADDPYQISTQAHLRYLSEYTASDSLEEKMLYFKLNNDIVFADTDPYFEPIGNGPRPFRYILDGDGHTIKGLRIDWAKSSNCDENQITATNVANNQIIFGLFGFIYDGGEVKNLVLDGVHITQSQQAGNTSICKIGVLAGKVGSNATIRNIAIYNSRIDDAGYSRNVRSIFMGGAIGEISSYWNGFNAFNTDNLHINNIYAEVDIDISNTVHAPVDGSAGSYTENCVGGIVGRLRQAPLQALPQGTVYKGTINAPTSAIGPLYGMWRRNGSNRDNKSLADAWTGEKLGSAAPYTLVDASEINSWFFGTKIYYAGAPVDINDIAPDQADAVRGTRSFLPHQEDGDYNYASQTGVNGMGQFQGVNRGTFATPDDMSTICRHFTTHLTSTDGLTWVSDANQRMSMVRGNPKIVVYVYDKAANANRPPEAYRTFSGLDPFGDEYPDGDDANSGADPYHAVKTIDEAFARILPFNYPSDNVIVLMGYVPASSGYLKQDNAQNARYAKPVTITGSYDNISYNGIFVVPNRNANLVVPAPTVFDDIEMLCQTGLNGANDGSKLVYIHCSNNDFTIGRNVTFTNFSNIDPTGYGLPASTRIADVSIIAGCFQYNKTDDLTYSPFNAIPGVTTLKIQSGGIGRIIGSARNNGVLSVTHNIYGSPTVPFCSHVEIDIPAAYGSQGNEYYKSLGYTHDIGLFTGGQTDGSVYADVNINFYNGKVARYAAGNISYGREVGEGYPNDSFFGRTVLNIYDGSIDELFGGSIGRSGIKDGIIDAYFYGTSIINIYGGEINSNVYAAGAGGVTGKGKRILGRTDVSEVTCDKHIPYYDNNTGSLLYGDYDTVDLHGVMPTVKGYDGTDISLEESHTEINIYGGTINGDVYGGGYGYSNNLDVRYVPYAEVDDGEGNIKKIALSGTVFGTTRVSMHTLDPSKKPWVRGNIYGASAGASDYNSKGNKPADVDFTKLALVFGHTEVELTGGTVGYAQDGKVVGGNVFGGSRGLGGGQYNDMAGLYGYSKLTLDGDVEVMGNIYGGNAYGDLLRRNAEPTDTIDGGTQVLIKGDAKIGNSVFGGSRGDTAPNFYAKIEGSTRVQIDGGTISFDSDLLVEDVMKRYNIYGASYYSCDVMGNTYVTITRSPLYLKPGYDFASYWADVTYRRFSVYGGGYGENATVRGDTYVTIDMHGSVVPSAEAPHSMVEGQMLFDVAGGGFQGSIGYWVDRNGKCKYDEGWIATGDGSYEEYRGGHAYVTVRGNSFVRKVVGGAYYASCGYATTNIEGGSVMTVTGGALLGYVHNKATTVIGSQNAVNTNSALFIHGDVFGGNDVKGIVGTAKYRDRNNNNELSFDINDGGPLFYADISPENVSDKGVLLNIYGGTIGGNVYGAGNGHFRGYYVPEWVEYPEGPARDYRKVPSQFSKSGFGYVYRSRPMTGSVHMNIRGNSVTDRVNIKGEFFGGGKSSTIGQWDTKRTFNDPRRLLAGGHLYVNFGSHVTVDGAVHMGAEGHIHGTQTTVPEGFDLNQEITTSARLDQLGEAAYDYWYWNSDTKKYALGFPAHGVIYKDGYEDPVTGNWVEREQFTGEHKYRGYMKHIEMNGDVELTFYNELYDDHGNRKHWVPSEESPVMYDAEDVHFRSFYLGGECGTMSNNNVMKYTSSDDDYTEAEGCIYRVTLPRGLTLHERAVMGSLNAAPKYFPYTDDTYTKIDSLAADYYNCDGGVVTQENFSYELIAFTDWYNSQHHTGAHDYDNGLYDTFWHRPEDGTLERDMWDNFMATLGNEYTLQFGPDAGIEILRRTYSNSYDIVPDHVDGYHFGLAKYKADPEHPERERAYIGKRASRNGVTAVKLGCSAHFEPLSIDPTDPDNPAKIYGGNIYGGCYQSGQTFGDVVLNVTSNMLGSREIFDPMRSETFNGMSSLRYNVGRVYGGGFGEETIVRGNTYVNLLIDFVGMNVFGGSNQGTITGTTHVTYIGSEQSYIYGALYGGSLRGTIGTVTYDADDNPVYHPHATEVKLYSGNVDHVYGGSCMSDLYGGTSVELCDQITTKLSHLDYDRLMHSALPGLESMSMARLIAGTVFGGNDISGHIYTNPGSENYSTYVRTYEVQGTPPNPGPSTVSEGKDSPGSVNGYNGFPLIGTLHGGSNGNYGSRTADGKYAEGSLVTFATGRATEAITIDLSQYADVFNVPNVEKVKLDINGGTIISAYGGGDNATVTEELTISVEYPEGNPEARAGFDGDNDATRVWNLLHLSNDEQFEEVLRKNDDNEFIYEYQIYRIFGGNDNADMDIQPKWDLKHSFIGSIYSGGNFGNMTYYNADADPNAESPWLRNRGLTLRIDHPLVHADAVYGGSRIGDIKPAAPEGYNWTGDNYGATLDIYKGVINQVYGGNDVSGIVYGGTNVNIYGAISGDVYCAGNGNHRYRYDADYDGPILEAYDNEYDGRYFILPKRTDEGFANGSTVTDAHKLLAINAYRPNVERSYLNIQGSEDSRVYVFGNVYCGGNSATVSSTVAADGSMQDIRFNIGDYVTLNGVYLGSNGEKLVELDMLRVTEKLNDISLTDVNTVKEPDIYPYLLDLYMRAVEVEAVPQNFNFSKKLQHAYIGNFYVGGNRGSMLTEHPIHLVFPEALTIYHHIVGGSNNADVIYNGVRHIGGLTRPLLPKYGETPKVHLQVKSMFEPWRIEYPLDGDFNKIKLVADVVDENGTKYFSNGACNIFGGCNESGSTVGNIQIDLYSDLMQDYDPDHSEIGALLAAEGITSKKETLIRNINDHHWRAFTVVGAGYGANTEVHGNIEINMLPAKASPSYAMMKGIMGDKLTDHPSAATLFGGSQLGTVVGNATVRVRDGKVFTNIYGASESANMYGSTQIMVGWPKYYVCGESGEYTLNRADTISEGHAATNADGTKVIKRSVKYRKGDIVSERIYNMMPEAQRTGKFTYVDGDMPHTYAATDTYFDKELDKKVTLNSTPFNWDDIEIHIGDHESRGTGSGLYNYYGHGNIYGGGYITRNSTVTLAGQKTLRMFTDQRTNSRADIGYGGNSTIIVHDNWENADVNQEANKEDKKGTVTGATLRGHITVGTGHYVPVEVKVGQNAIGKYVYDPITRQYKHLSIYTITQDDINNTQFYELQSDGGIYGEGRQVFIEGFAAGDIAYYGYASFTPQSPKLLNTIQRFDVMSITDCCMQLEGSSDFVADKNDTELFSLTRVGELQLHSSLSTYAPDASLNQAVISDTAPYANMHNVPRSRNYVSFQQSVLYLSAIVSDVDFESSYFDRYGAKTTETYKQHKAAIINEYYDVKENNASDTEAFQEARAAFDRRNLGTSANMIGLNNGKRLRIQGAITQGENVPDKIYYGPVYGVIEMKLLTLDPEEGGGYVYAYNKHDDPQNFLESTGNFVYPGSVHSDYHPANPELATYNYIFDDCHPEGIGWDGYEHTEEGLPEIHYWYVNGSHFYYDVTVTGYTYNQQLEFLLDNSDNLIYLYGVEPGSQFTLKEVVWEPSSNAESDIQDYHSSDSHPGKDYKLYLSVDKNPNLRHLLDVNSEDAFVTQLSRADYFGYADTPEETADVDVHYLPPISVVNKYRSDDNLPLLGITLVDNVDNSAKDYYLQHLSEPERVAITFTAKKDDGIEYQYTVRLTINYLFGPVISGHPVIENCALPGEYIYVHAKNVDVDMDDEMVVSSRNWYLVPPDVDVTSSSDISAHRMLMDDYKFRDINGNVIDGQQVSLPAWWFFNNWQIVYAVRANGHDFYVTPDPDAKYPRMWVHNYHRAYPWNGLTYEDDPANPGHPLIDADGNPVPQLEKLNPVAGCRIYIEDDRDLKRSLQVLATAQQGALGTTITGQDMYPQYAEGLEMYLMADVKMPTPAELQKVLGSLSPESIFKGSLHGNGYSIDLNGNDYFVYDLQGTICDVAFLANTDNANVRAIATNRGTIKNCYYYNLKRNGKGSLTTGAAVENCYQNTPTGNVTGLQRATEEQFAYGEVAYNLNLNYLEKRYGNESAEVNYLYNDGEYRYARYSRDGRVPDALRNDPIPNYRDFRGIRSRITSSQFGVITGEDASAHNNNPELDSRWDDIEHVFKPTITDHIFFAQDLSEPGHLPVAMYPSPELRVYRASGFYGSKEDKGYHYNVGAVAMHPGLTAIDFTGVRDTGRSMKVGLDSYVDAAGNAMQTAFYPPMLDLPQGGITSFAVLGNASIDDTDKVTKNLLVYTKRGESMYEPLHYAQADDEGTIQAHHIERAADGTFAANGGLLHLVDKQDYNAPIAFSADTRAWYQRAPAAYSNGNTAWDGICLPFTPLQVVANSVTGIAAYDHGEISHFYGSEQLLHEYWLRGLKSVKAEGSDITLLFERPMLYDAASATSGTMCNSTLYDEALSPLKMYVADYHYSNTWFADTYGDNIKDRYVEAHNQYTAEGRTFEKYTYLTEAVPYIISFPGRRYYEFDMSGEFFADMHTGVKVEPQIVTFQRSGVATTLGVTDDNPAAGTLADGYVHHGTYMHRTLATAEYGINDLGEGTDFTLERTAYPFRTFVTAPSLRSRALAIGVASPDEIEADDEGDEPGMEEELGGGLVMKVRGRDLIVDAPCDVTVMVFDPAGRMVARVEAFAGHNEFTDFEPGTYMAQPIDFDADAYKFVVK